MTTGEKPKTATPIEHVIVLMLENRSFDHMLGSLAATLPGLDGIKDDPARVNKANGKKHPPAPGALRVFPDKLDPKHEYPNVKKQLAKGAMSGFAQDFADSYPHATDDEIDQVMRYFKPDELPALHGLARSFTVCNRWFSSVPGPTWANRFFAHSGTSLGHLSMPGGLFNLHLHWYNQDTIYDRLSAKGFEWKVYYGDVPQSLLMVHQLKPPNLSRYHHLSVFFDDIAARDPDAFPAFTFLEPDYYSPSPNDDHPPHDVLAGDGLIGRVYNALQASPDLFQTTLLVVVWDEHGGFYDHVPPPTDALPPDHASGEFGFDFRTLGVRVPNVLISPWMGQRIIGEPWSGNPIPAAQAFDHTSILKFVIDNWSLAPLGARIAKAQSLETLLLSESRDVASLPVAIHTESTLGPAVPRPSDSLNENQSGLVSYSQYLASCTTQDPVRLNQQTGFMMTSARAQADSACDNVDAYIRQGHEDAKKLRQELPLLPAKT
jgi:phospholipase C